MGWLLLTIIGLIYHYRYEEPKYRRFRENARLRYEENLRRTEHEIAELEARVKRLKGET